VFGYVTVLGSGVIASVVVVTTVVVVWGATDVDVVVGAVVDDAG